MHLPNRRFLTILLTLLLVDLTTVHCQLNDVTDCLSQESGNLYLQQIAGCFLGKFVQLVDDLMGNSSTPFVDLSHPTIPEFVKLMRDSARASSNKDKLATILAPLNGGGVDAFLQRLYLTRRHGADDKPAPASDDDLPTLADIFHDLRAVLEQSASVDLMASSEGGSGSGSINELLLQLARRKLQRRSKQLLMGRVIPIIGELFGDRLARLEMALQMASADGSEEYFQNFDGQETNSYDNLKPGVNSPRDDALEELGRIVRCLRSRPEADFEDGLDWLKCLFVCQDLRFISTCMAKVTDSKPACSRVPWLGDLIIRLFSDAMKLQNCYFNIMSAPAVLTEGGATHELVFQTYMSPGVHCFPPNVMYDLVSQVVRRAFNLQPKCTVQISITTTSSIYNLIPNIPALNVSQPRCNNGSTINQVAMGWHEDATNASGIIVLNDDNWDHTFRIPLTAVVDHKYEAVKLGDLPSLPPGLPTVSPTVPTVPPDPNVEINLSMRFMVDETRMNTTKIPMTVVDVDPTDPVICQSINDPHIITFDGLYYNNLYHGWFELYNHSSLPYEIQVAYQACSNTTMESCSCAVAVRSGDDVFVLDRCRLHANYCSENDESCRMLQAVLYLNGELTPGTRIFQTDEGLGYQVILPHGGMLTVKANGELLNIWFVPSPYDKGPKTTSGLCGSYDGDVKNDWTFRDGSLCDGSKGCDYNRLGAPISGSQPRPFILDWRVKSNGTIFNGVEPMLANDPQTLLSSNLCRCLHAPMNGIRCVCGYDQLVETCNFDLGHEFTAGNLTALYRKNPIITGSDPTKVDWKDFNLEYIPPNRTQPGERDSQATACKQALYVDHTNQFIQDWCFIDRTGLTRPPNVYRDICASDFQITGAIQVDWLMSTIEAVKFWCQDRVNRFVYVSRNISRDDLLENTTCINECYRRGKCVKGSCECDDGFGGPDCRLHLAPPRVVMDQTILCDVRYENCAYATVYGQRFVDDHSLTCRVTSRQVLPNDKASAFTKNVHILYVSPNQIACQLESYMTSYDIVLEQNDQPVPGNVSPFTQMAYDSVCYNCDMTRMQCNMRPDTDPYCFIGGVCYANLQLSSTDDCLLCNVSYSRTTLFDSLDEVCVAKREEEKRRRQQEKDEETIRIIVSATLSAAIVLVTIIAFIFNTKKERAKKQKIANQKNISRQSSSASSGKIANAALSSSGSGSDEAFDTFSQKDLPATNATVMDHKVGTPADGDAKLAMDVDLANKPAGIDEPVGYMANGLVRSRGNSASSVRSAGMNGFGPLHLSRRGTMSYANDNANQAGIENAGFDHVTQPSEHAAYTQL